MGHRDYRNWLIESMRELLEQLKLQQKRLEGEIADLQFQISVKSGQEEKKRSNEASA